MNEKEIEELAVKVAEKVVAKLDKEEDEHHTIDELYLHRHALFCALMLSNPQISWYSLHHHPSQNNPMYEGYFIAGMSLFTGDISYHMPVEFIRLIEINIQKLEFAPEYDGYTSDDVLHRLHTWNLERWIYIR